MPGQDDDESTSFQTERSAAYRAFGEGDSARTVRHAARALSLNPSDPGLQAVMDVLIGRVLDPLSLVPLDAGQHFSLDAAVAYVLGRCGRIGEALDVLVAVGCRHPEVPYLIWVESWLLLPDACERLDVQRVVSAVARVAARFPKRPTRGSSAHFFLARLLGVLRVIDARRGDGVLTPYHAWVRALVRGEQPPIEPDTDVLISG